MTDDEEKSMRRKLLHLQETVQGEPLIPETTGKTLISLTLLILLSLYGLLFLTAARADVASSDDVAPEERVEEFSVPPPSSHPSGPGPSSVDKGKAPLVEEAGEEEEEEEEEGEGGDLPLQRKWKAPSLPGYEDVNPEGGASEKRARMDSSSSEEDEPELDSMPVPQRLGKEKVSGPIPDNGRPQKIHLKVRTIKLEEGVDLPPYEPLPAPDSAMTHMSRPIFSNLGASGAFGPQSRCAANLTSAEGRKVLLTLSKPNVVLANAVEGLKVLWNSIRAPTFDPVEDHDTLSKIQPLLCQIAEVKPHIAPACNHLDRWLSKTLKHICSIKSILPYAVDPKEILEDHCDRKEGFVEAVEAEEEVLDRLEALEQEEVALKGEISVDLKLKA
ncbi:hypothetical protein Pyn_32784 [Prunus yedoensis var. nudiflora]|uniref:Uncharacterized protein n=1 Tax=Prunus yedoensis var. nudiflora TaxID=2094558 RepID=A0A314XIE4_PRUYE|nr:hypothetical protein Pyn_32784 [Prunus yedoensis var. nudiflora]